MPTFRCPHCEAEIEHLDYNESVTRYGTCDLLISGGLVDADNYDTNDYGDNNGDTFYQCPECNDELQLREVMIIPVAGDAACDLAAPRIQPNSLPAWAVPCGGNVLSGFDFCSSCHDLKAKAEIAEGKCETCRN